VIKPTRFRLMQLDPAFISRGCSFLKRGGPISPCRDFGPQSFCAQQTTTTSERAIARRERRKFWSSQEHNQQA
jgi:hypothetical protein